MSACVRVVFLNMSEVSIMRQSTIDKYFKIRVKNTTNIVMVMSDELMHVMATYLCPGDSIIVFNVCKKWRNRNYTFLAMSYIRTIRVIWNYCAFVTYGGRFYEIHDGGCSYCSSDDSEDASMDPTYTHGSVIIDDEDIEMGPTTDGDSTSSVNDELMSSGSFF